MKIFFVFLGTEKRIEKKISLTFFHSKIYVALLIFTFPGETFSRPQQIRLRRLRKLGVSSANEKSDESGNQKTSRPDEVSNNNYSTSSDKTALSPSTADKDDNKNVILAGELIRLFCCRKWLFNRNLFEEITPSVPAPVPKIQIGDKIENDMNISNQQNIISNMETDECETKTKMPMDDRMDVEDNENENKQDDSVLKCISRVLDVVRNFNFFV